jgi:hypothetical protein
MPGIGSLGKLFFHFFSGNRQPIAAASILLKISGASCEFVMPLPEIPFEPGSWKAPYTKDRTAFVRAFYNYARANPNGRPQLWSEWLKSGIRIEQ